MATVTLNSMATMANDLTDQSFCACGCGEHTARYIRLLPLWQRGTAEALRWAEVSIAPMREAVAVAYGHEAGGIEGYVTREEEG